MRKNVEKNNPRFQAKNEGAVLTIGLDGSKTPIISFNNKSVFSGFNLDIIHRDSVYSAAALLAKEKFASVLIVGTYKDLSKENGRFLNFASRRGYQCCCLLEKNANNLQKSEIFTGDTIHLVSEPKQFEEIITSFAKSFCEYENKDIHPDFDEQLSADETKSPSRFNRIDFAPTKDELNALLEGMG